MVIQELAPLCKCKKGTLFDIYIDIYKIRSCAEKSHFSFLSQLLLASFFFWVPVRQEEVVIRSKFSSFYLFIRKGS
jgi:hypothetical protein